MNDEKEEIKKLEQRLGIPEGFYNSIFKEDDWSFVIKLSALIEASCTELLAHKFGEPKLKENIAHLEHARPKIGKIALLKKLDAINSNQEKLLIELAELRNKLAHRLSDVNFQFHTYVQNMDSNQQKSFVKKIGYLYSDEIDLGDRKITKNRLVLGNAKTVIWWTVMDILACLHLDFESTDLKNDHKALLKYMNLTSLGKGHS